MVQATQKNETLARILTAARAEFSEKGLDAARLESVARRANVTKQLVHHYFQTKEALYRVVFDAVAKAVTPLLDHTTYEALTPTEAIRRLINLIVDLHVENPGMATFALDQGLHRAGKIDLEPSFVRLTRDFITNVIDPILKRGAASGEFRADMDPMLFYVATYHLATGCFMMGSVMTTTLGVDFDSPEGVELWRAYVINFTLAALRADSGRAESDPTRA
jgi:AcrR family transcriptional regulator